jgi:hypothetical protein
MQSVHLVIKRDNDTQTDYTACGKILPWDQNGNTTTRPEKTSCWVCREAHRQSTDTKGRAE